MSNVSRSLFVLPTSCLGILFETMLNIDGSIYLAYSGAFAKDAPQTRLLKRAWESLRRSVEFRDDCQSVTASDGPQLQARKDSSIKNGVWP